MTRRTEHSNDQAETQAQVEKEQERQQRTQELQGLGSAGSAAPQENSGGGAPMQPGVSPSTLDETQSAEELRREREHEEKRQRLQGYRPSRVKGDDEAAPTADDVDEDPGTQEAG